jgi:tripartite-type tricarboxylate transporter receptor subunit TctC
VSAASALPHTQAGRLKTPAVTRAKRLPPPPEIPALSQTIPGHEAEFWYGLPAPERKPEEIVARLNQELNRVLKLPDVTERLRRLGVEPAGGTAADAGHTHTRRDREVGEGREAIGRERGLMLSKENNTCGKQSF